MRYAVDCPNYGDYVDPRTHADLAYEAEQAGWDGFFVWDHMNYLGPPWQTGGDGMSDPWIILAAVALRTEHIKIGPMVTPLPRRRPWKLARETVTLDRFSNGRLILGVGLGAPAEIEYEQLGEDGDAKVRAAKLDEGLDVLTGLWSGEPFSYRGEHYQVDNAKFLPRPVQSPRIPIWVAGLWPNKPPFRRAARWDGAFPISEGRGPVPFDGGMTGVIPPSEIEAMMAYIKERRTSDAPFDVVFGGMTPTADPRGAAETVAAYAEAGLTWWVESIGPWRGSCDESLARVRRGPPKL